MSDQNRKIYKAPELVRYGKVEHLTATGTKSGNENSGNKQGKN